MSLATRIEGKRLGAEPHNKVQPIRNRPNVEGEEYIDRHMVISDANVCNLFAPHTSSLSKAWACAQSQTALLW